MPCPFRGSHRSSPSLRICVIGAGAAGLCAARRAVEQLPRAEVTILEQSDQLGGTWVYTEQPQGTQPTHSSMYDELRTNIPKEIMHFCDFPIESVDFPDPQNSDDSFPRREVILSYLKRFAEPIKHLIKFNLRVLSIAPIAQAKNSHLNGQHQAKDGTSDTKWRIVSEETIGSKRRFVEHFDVVFVCTGHYWCPRIPIFANKLAIRWAHSHSYRKAEHFAGMKVAIVGANLSGLEIALQLAKYAEKVYLINSNANATLGTVKGSPNSEVPVELNGSRVTDAVADSLVLADGRVVGPLHFVLFCTGYRFSFPFFDQQTEAPVVRCDGNFVSPLIGHVAHPHFLSSLFFVGLNLLVVPFSCFDIQVKRKK